MGLGEKLKEYHKINSVFKRDEMGKFTTEFACPEFEFLKDNTWNFEEKVDGTNIRVIWLGGTNGIEFKGKTDNATIPVPLQKKLAETFQKEKFLAAFPEAPQVTLYGEGFGAKIQKGGGNYIRDGVDFVLFDVKVGDWWLVRDDVRDVARKLGITTVPEIGAGSLQAAIELTKRGFKSQWGDFPAEGIVLRPKVPLFARNGDRIITKLKLKDWR